MTDIIGSRFLYNNEIIPVDQFTSDLYLPEGRKTIYEVIRIEEGVPLFIDDYLERLENSFRLNKSIMNWSGKEIRQSVLQLIRINQHESGPVKLVFGCDEPYFFMAYIMKPHLPKPEEYITGVKTILMRETRLNPNAKVWNTGLRNKSVMLMQRANAYEAILVDQDGYITEASRSNVFFIKGNEVFTCPDEMVLPGITRKKVLEILRLAGIKVNFKAIRVDQLAEFASCFLTGTARKIVPVKLIDEHSFSVTDKTLSFVAHQFSNYVQQYIHDNSEKFEN